MSLVQLRKSGPMVEPNKWPIKPENDPPRALRALGNIIENDLCHRCSSCVGICPTNVLGRDEEEYPVVKNLSACTDCDLCVKVCPGDEFDAKSIAKQMYGYFPDRKDMHGHFEQAYLSYATDEEIRAKSTSGGLVTGLLVSLLQRGEIDGAVVISTDPKDLWKGVPIVARTEEAIREATKAKYAIVGTNAVFKEIREIEGRYALVGLPCQIHGFHKAARLDKRLRERVVVTIGLFCHAAIEHEPMKYIWDSLGDYRGKAKTFISRYGKHSGTPHIELKDGGHYPVYFPQKKGFRPSSMEIINMLYRMYTPPRCLTCYDSTAEFADIAVGDPWMPKPHRDIDFYQGYTLVLARTKKADKILQDSFSNKDIELLKLKKETAKTANTAMGVEKRNRAFRIIETRRRQGHAIPQYNFTIPSASGKELLATEMNMLSHVFCFISFGRRFLLKLLFSNVGYCALWLNNKRRIFRTWRRDAWAQVKREVFKINADTKEGL